MASDSPPIVPQQKWAVVENRLRALDAAWLRALSLEERYALYQDLFQVLRESRQKLPGDWERLERQQWEDKLALRRRLGEAFSKLDRWRSE
jgi:hypothetical protein